MSEGKAKKRVLVTGASGLIGKETLAPSRKRVLTYTQFLVKNKVQMPIGLKMKSDTRLNTLSKTPWIK